MSINKYWCATPFDNLEPTDSDNGAFILRNGEDRRVQLKVDAVGVLTAVGLAVEQDATFEGALTVPNKAPEFKQGLSVTGAQARFESGLAVAGKALTVRGEAKVNDKHVVTGAGSKALYLVQGSVAAPNSDVLTCSDDRVVGKREGGLYTLTFNDVFSDMPTLLVSLLGSVWAHKDEIFSRVFKDSSNQITARISTTNDKRELEERPFTFIAIGPV